MGWYEALKDAVTVADRLKDSELEHRLAAVRVECAKLAEENAKLRQDLLELRTQVKRGGSRNSDSVISGSLASPTPPEGGDTKERGDEENETESRGDL
jgi:cell division septum initiation protein DivIVA